MAKKEYRDNVIIRKRMVVVFIILFIGIISLVGKLLNIMVSQSPKLKKRAIAQWTSEVKIDAKRGRILDRNGNELAISANVYRVDLDMNALKTTMEKKHLTQQDIASKLSAALDIDTAEVKKVLNKKLPNGLPLQSATLKRRIEKDKADKVRELDLRGILVSADTKRYYPNNNFLAHVLGHTNSDGKGLTGVELYYNNILSGKPGVRVAEIDRKSKELPYAISEYSKPEDGKDLVLTIDEMIQHFSEKIAQQALKDNNAKAVTVLVMDPKTGEILALANKPDYNPNNPWEENKNYAQLQENWRNRAVNDTFEPGSIFKVITAATALEENVVSESTKFTCNGSITIGGQRIKCWKHGGHGVQEFPDILKNSCNMGFAELGKMIGKDTLYKYIRKMGFGSKTGIDLPGEAKGIIKAPQNISEVDLATISFGQANTVSPVQYLTAFNAVANGGKLIKPHIMKEIAHFNGEQNKEEIDKENAVDSKQVLTAEKTAVLRSYLERVVAEGGGKNAFIPGYHIGGKTGTAQKAGKGGYMSGKYISSFAGMAPVSDPKFTVLVSIDEPDPGNYYAAQTAAPAAKILINDIFNYLALNSDPSTDPARNMLKDIILPEIRGMKKADADKTLKDLKLEVEFQGSGEKVVDVSPKPGYTIKEGSKVIVYTGGGDLNQEVAIPNVKGHTVGEAKTVLKKLGITCSVEGEGIISTQSLEPNKKVMKGTFLKLKAEPLGD